MKHLIALLAAFASLGLTAGGVALKSGLNTVNEAGQVIAAEAVTASASATVALKSVSTVTTYSNEYASVTTPHMVYSFAITNFDGNTTVATNVWDSFAYPDWVWTNGATKIVGEVSTSRTNVTTSVISRRVPSASYTVTNDLVSVSASNHYGSGAPESATYFFGGRILVTGAAADDSVIVIIK